MRLYSADYVRSMQPKIRPQQCSRGGVFQLESLLPQSAQDVIGNSWMSKMTASNVLASNADVYIQFIATEGTTHAANVTPVPCFKQEIKLDLDAGTAAQFFGLTNGASSSVNLFTKTYTHWAPDTPFCRGI